MAAISSIALQQSFNQIIDLEQFASTPPIITQRRDRRTHTPTMAAVAFEPSLSTSAMHLPLSSATAPSMADSLPNINFGFKELRDRMDTFTSRFDQFIEKGRKQVLEERNQFRMNVAELQGG